MDKELTLPVDEKRLAEFTQILQKYKAGKASVERRTVAAENWWKLRNSAEERKSHDVSGGFQAVSGWLHNVIVSKHADAMDAFPEPNILPREPDDRAEARILSKILPVILEQNAFEKTYSDGMWQKLKTGTGVYRVGWDTEKSGGLGDIAIERVDLLNVFWEPGVRDIQDSAYFFHTKLEDNDALTAAWPQLAGKLRSMGFAPTRFLYDDSVSVDGKSTVIEVYYKKKTMGRDVLHYCKYVGSTLLYASENEDFLREMEGETDFPRGLYEHGRYPFVFDSLFPVEGSPCGYGYIDLCRNAQTQIDMLQTAFLKNTMVGAVPRYFQRADGAVNEEEFLNLNNPIVHVSGNLGEDSLRTVDYRPLSGSYLEMRTSVINELRETSGNTETSVGLVNAGVTAASAIAALQEASGKGSRDSTRASYRVYGEMIELCIELIRQFYDLPRQFRITGALGLEQFVSYDNHGLRPQALYGPEGMDLGMRRPVFDIRVLPQKSSAYTRMSQNELALQFYQLGFFTPERSDQALACMSMMEFEGKDELMQQLFYNGNMQKELALYQQYALAMTQKYEPERAEALMAGMIGKTAPPKKGRAHTESGREDRRMEKARARASGAGQPGGGR